MAPPSRIAQFQQLNAVIHEKTRLAIMTFLVTAREASFSELKGELRLTDGNLNLHMRVLEKHGYVTVHKAFVRRRPRTTYQVTSRGQKAFQDYVSVLEKIIQLGSRERG
jgi:predicted ArsR family transcriptional regulator